MSETMNARDTPVEGKIHDSSTFDATMRADLYGVAEPTSHANETMASTKTIHSSPDASGVTSPSPGSL